MVEKVKKAYSAFTLEGSDLVEENEQVLNGVQEKEAKQEEQQKAIPSAAAPSSSQPAQSEQPAQRIAPVVNVQPMKATKTVKLILPIEYYFSLSRIKECTGKSLQDLAAQAVMDFVDKFGKE